MEVLHPSDVSLTFFTGLDACIQPIVTYITHIDAPLQNAMQFYITAAAKGVVNNNTCSKRCEINRNNFSKISCIYLEFLSGDSSKLYNEYVPSKNTGKLSTQKHWH